MPLKKRVNEVLHQAGNGGLKSDAKQAIKKQILTEGQEICDGIECKPSTSKGFFQTLFKKAQDGTKP